MTQFKKRFHVLDDQIINVIDMKFENIEAANPQFKTFFSAIKELGEVYLIGGFIRDTSINKTPKDIDLIVKTNESKLLTILEDYNYTKNKFGGYKLRIGSAKIDLWVLNKHWVFQSNFSSKKNIQNISKGAIININSAVINLSKHKLFCKYYNEGVESGSYKIDFIDKGEIKVTSKLLVGYIDKTYKLKKSYNLRLSTNVQSLFKKK